MHNKKVHNTTNIKTRLKDIENCKRKSLEIARMKFNIIDNIDKINDHCYFVNEKISSPTVKNITPKNIGGGGEVLLVITGSEFSTNSFSLIPNDPNVGNFAYLISRRTRVVYNCKSHPNGMTQNQIQCYTPKLPIDSYFVRIKVDGKDITDYNSYCNGYPEDWHCLFHVKKDLTPTIDSLYPPTGLPRAYRSHFIIEKEFGKSIINTNAMRICYNDKPCLYESYAYVDKVSTTTISTGMHISLEGNYLSDETNFPIIVEISNAPAKVLTKADNKLVIIAPKFSNLQKLDNYPGNRGSTLEIWRGKVLEFVDLENINKLTSNEIGVKYELKYFEDTAINLVEDLELSGKFSGFFIPNVDGAYKFFIMSTGIGTLYVSTDENSNNKEKIASIDKYGSGDKGTLVNGNKENNLLANKKYYYEMLFVIKTKLKIVNIGFIQYDSKSLESVTAYAKNEKQSIVLSKNKIYHELQIDFGQLTETTGSNIEIQSYAIRISAIVVGSEFRLCWVNTKLCTVKLTMSSNENDFKLAINNVVQKESKIIIKLESISSANVLTISTITTSGTDIEKLTVVEIVMNTISFSITSNSINEKTKKTPFTYRFKFESSTGVYYTEEIEFNSFESIVQSKIYNALSPRCSHKIKNDETQSYDDDSSDEYESLCGKSFKKWAYNLRTDSIKPLSLKSNRYVKI
ncbi:hypothetical protein A3Q56_01031 [Intoshia linei]|uniref:PA14 domain-containing protein n=1 Tax=Intoshia linei TaxID=1819745 RepID=A0A177BA43_9BILA|nr:hypothetical protein A3Q56_01031 [Intoshia linei]